MERFQCPDCGFIIDVEFSEKETQRDVPCGRCYYETFEYNEELKDTVKQYFGSVIKCIKGAGI